MRSNDSVSASLPVLALNLQQPNSELSRQLRQALDVANVSVIENIEDLPQDTVPVLNLSAERMEVQPVTVNPRARAAQYQIDMAVTLSLFQGTNALLPIEDLAVQRVYYEDTEYITGNLEEADVIQSEMRQELVNRILRRLEAIGP